MVQAALFDYTPDLDTVKSRFEALDAFVDEHLPSERSMGLRRGSQIVEAIDALADSSDLRSTPIFAHTSQQSGVGAEMSLKFSEFAHVSANTIHVGDIRDRALNLLKHDKAYLIGIVPDLEDPRSWADVVYRDNKSINEQFGDGTNESQLPLIAFSFGRPDIDNGIRSASKYGRQGLISIETYAPTWKFRSLIQFAGVQLFAFGVLSELWGDPDSRLDSHVIEDVYADDLVKWSEL